MSAPHGDAALPIDPLLAAIVETLRSANRLVLRAAPGAGKTTRVPPALLDAGLARNRAVVVLEPRRIAARAAAEYVAERRGHAVGDEVGYRVRFEQRGGAATRLWYVTEGLFSRGLAADPYLEDVGIVVLDEFHERHLQGDLALGVVSELQATVRPDLKLVVMSATLETDRLASYLGGARVLTSEGRAYPVAIEYLPERSTVRIGERVRAALARVLGANDDGGDVLVFLPGAGAIRQAAEAVAPLAETNGLDVVLLHGDLPLDQQRRVIRRGARRKVVLSTNVAETALTIEGVTTVIDSGLAREARFDARLGINRLEEIRISRASAEQRAGRAGRTAPGRCLRLWTAAEHAERRERELPEIARLDLAAAMLELHAWGATDASSFPWLEPPPASAVRSAEALLVALGATDPARGALTDVGRRMLALAASPRLARMLIESDRLGAEDGPLVAALASERDVLVERRALGGGAAPRLASGRSDLLLRAELFREAAAARFAPAACRALGLDPQAVRAVERARRQLASALGYPATATASEGPEALLRCVLAGFPDRVARRRERGSPRAVMVGGTGLVLDPSSVVRDDELFIAVDLDVGPRRERSEARVAIASAVERSWLEAEPGAVVVETVVEFDPKGERVVARRRERYGDLLLREAVRFDVDPAEAALRLAEEAKRDPAAALSLGRDDEALLDRLAFAARALPELGLPSSRSDVLAALIDRLAVGRTSFAELRRASIAGEIRALLGPRTLLEVDREVPAELTLPSGRRVRVAYPDGKSPVLRARIQDLFGLAATPRMARGRVAVTVEILAPSNRPVQITEDLESFWQRTYPEVRKQLRGRYPKHPWPESPWQTKI